MIRIVSRLPIPWIVFFVLLCLAMPLHSAPPHVKKINESHLWNDPLGVVVPTCFLFPKYVVLVVPHKEGEVGESVQANRCSKQGESQCCNMKDGKAYDNGADSYFLGVENDLLFLDDGTAGSSRGLTIFSLATEKKLFEATVIDTPRSPRAGKLEYNVDAGVDVCSPPGHPKECWNRLKDQTEFSSGQLMPCVGENAKITNALDAHMVLDLQTMKDNFSGKIFCGYRE